MSQRPDRPAIPGTHSAIAAGASPAPGDRSPHSDDWSRNPRFQDYLDHVFAPLVGPVPYERRMELRREIGAHLASLADAHIELGMEPEAALSEALRQFGPPARVGREWTTEYLRRPERDRRAVLRPTLGMLRWFGTAAASSALVLFMAERETWMMPLMLPGVGITLPITVGLIAGFTMEGRRGLAAFYANAALALLTRLLLLVLPGDFELPGDSTLFSLLACQCLFWLPIGTVAAEMGGVLRRMIFRWARSLWAVG